MCLATRRHTKVQVGYRRRDDPLHVIRRAEDGSSEQQLAWNTRAFDGWWLPRMFWYFVRYNYIDRFDNIDDDTNSQYYVDAREEMVYVRLKSSASPFLYSYAWDGPTRYDGNDFVCVIDVYD